MCWVLCAPAQTTLLRAVKGGLLSSIWCLTKAGHPVGEPRIQAQTPRPPCSPKIGAFGIKASEQARGASGAL